MKRVALCDFVPYLTEFVGVVGFLFLALGSIVAGNDLVAVAVAHWIGLAAMVAIFSLFCKAHFNPAVTAMFWIAGEVNLKTALGYIGAQLTGAALACLLLFLFFGKSAREASFGATAVSEGTAIWQAISAEAMLTLFLLGVVWLAAHRLSLPGYQAGFFIGAIVAADVLVGASLTGASMNPARSFGPALASGYWADHFVYWAGPLAASVVAGLSMRFAKIKKERCM